MCLRPRPQASHGRDHHARKSMTFLAVDSGALMMRAAFSGEAMMMRAAISGEAMMMRNAAYNDGAMIGGGTAAHAAGADAQSTRRPRYRPSPSSSAWRLNADDFQELPGHDMRPVFKPLLEWRFVVKRRRI